MTSGTDPNGSFIKIPRSCRTSTHLRYSLVNLQFHSTTSRLFISDNRDTEEAQELFFGKIDQPTPAADLFFVAIRLLVSSCSTLWRVPETHLLAPVVPASSNARCETFEPANQTVCYENHVPLNTPPACSVRGRCETHPVLDTLLENAISCGVKGGSLL